MRSIGGATTLIIAALLSGCSVEANYTLRLIPRVPTNQSPFDGAPEAHLRLRDASGNTDWIGLGTFDSGTRQQGGLGPLAEHRIGLALGPDDPAASLAGLLAWGEARPVTLDVGGEELSVEFLLAQTGGVGVLGDLPSPSLGAAVATLPDGRVYLFGGASPASGCTSIIRKISTLQTGTWAFTPVGAELPEPVCYAVATVAEVGGRPLILVSGGETALNAHDSRVTTLSVFDPQTDTFIWTTQGNVSRARHTARAFSDGKVLLVGASQGRGAPAPNNATWEVVDVGRQSVEGFGGSALAPWNFMSAEIAGALAVCGGATWVGTTVTPSDTCAAIGPDGTLTALPSLPIPLHGAAMTALSDGRLLVAGGITQVGAAGSALPTTDRAFILDPQGAGAGWTEVASLGESRSFAYMAPDAAGGAVLIGGVGAGWPFASGLTAAGSCGERFINEESGGRWETLSPCAAAGSGLLPSAAVSSGGLLFTLGGRDGSSTDGSGFGVVGLGP